MVNAHGSSGDVKAFAAVELIILIFAYLFISERSWVVFLLVCLYAEVFFGSCSAQCQIQKKNTKLLFYVLSLYPTWVIDPDTALIKGQISLCQSG
jgi:hypothetical protein